MQREFRATGTHLHRAFGGELESIGGQVEQHPAQGHRMSNPKVGVRRRDLHLQVLLFRNRLNDVTNRFQNVRHRERNRVQIHQTITAAGQLDHVARDGAESKRSAVYQAELPFLNRVDRAAATALQGFRQEENRGEGRAQVVRHLHDQFQAIRGGKPVGKML